MRIVTAVFLLCCLVAHKTMAHEFQDTECSTTGILGLDDNCSSENMDQSPEMFAWRFTKEDHAELGPLLQAVVNSNNHINCGEKSGHIQLTILCANDARLIVVDGTCRFADHAKFARFNFKFDGRRWKKYDGHALNEGVSLAITDEPSISQIVDHLVSSRSIDVLLQPFPWLPSQVQFNPIGDAQAAKDLSLACNSVSGVD